MKYLSCYDDTEKVIDYLCDKLDTTEPEIIDWLLDVATTVEDDALGDALRELNNK